MRFLIDTNVLIQSSHTIPQDIFPSFWERLASSFVSGDAVMHESVFNELEAHKDELLDWMQERNQIACMSISKQAAMRYVEICEWANSSHQYTAEAKRVFTDSARADAWLCAEADISGFVLVSHEKRSNSTSKIKIPNVCAEFGIDCVDGFEFMRRPKFRF